MKSSLSAWFRIAALSLFAAPLAAQEARRAAEEARSAAGEAPSVLLLVDRHGEFAIERVPLTEGRDVVLESSAETGVIDVLLPVSAGRSASVEGLGAKRSLRVHAEGGMLAARTSVAGGRAFDRPPRPYTELAGETIYVCVSGSNGRHQAFLVRNYRDVEVLGEGPFLDLFGGKVPLSAHDYAVTTDAEPRPVGGFLPGECALVLDRWIFVDVELEQGQSGVFALDLGAGSTVVARRFVPDGCPIEPSSIARYQAGQREDLRYTAGGATGAMSDVVGRARLLSLRLGSARFEAVEVDVMDSLPQLAGRAIDGILGLDVLRRAPRISISYTRQRLTLGGVAMPNPDGVVPCLALASHLFVGVQAGSSRWQCIVDTGAPETILDARAPAVSAWKTKEDAGAARGLDGGAAGMVRIVEFGATLGSHTWKSAGPWAADLAVFAPLRLPDQSVGLLGNDLLSGLGTIEIDLSAGELRFRAKP